MSRTDRTVGASALWFPGGWIRGSVCPVWMRRQHLIPAMAGSMAFAPSAGMCNHLQLAFLPENREGLNYEDLEHASLHGVAKDICLSTL